MSKKALSLPILISLVIGNMIGTGIYVLPASLAKFGSAAILSWVFTCAGALMLALVYSGMNKRFPQTGGPYIYCKQAFGKPAGFVIGYTYWMSTMVSAATIAIATTGYLGYLYPVLDANTPQYSQAAVLFTELAIVWIFAGINLWGIHSAGIVQFILTIIKILPLILIAAVGVFYIHPAYIAQDTTPHQFSFSAIGSASALTFWAFVGLEAATIPAENTKGSRHIFIATFFGTLVTGILYLSSTYVLMGLMPGDQLQVSQFPFATAGTILFGSSAAFLVTLCTIASGLGALNSTILLQGMVVFAAARDKMFPKSFAQLSKHNVPVRAQLLSSTLVSLLMILTIDPYLLKQFDFVAMLATMLTLITYLTTSLASLKFDVIHRTSISSLMLKPMTWISVLAVSYALWMIVNFESRVTIATLIIASLCFPVYFLTVRKYDDGKIANYAE